jgi:chromosome partitioning protein
LAKIIAVSNQKGGVGKTTSAINIASSIAVSEKRVLLVDLDPQANATSGMGFVRGDFEKSIYEILVEDEPIENVIQRTELPCLNLLPSTQDLVGAEVELVSVLGRESRLQDALKKVENIYDYVIIDCPPALGILTVNALTAAHSVLIPVQCEYYAMEGLSQLLKTISLIKKRLNQALEREGILLTMYDKRNNLSHQIESEIRQHFGEEVFPIVIPRNIKLTEAPSHGKPIILYDITCPGALAYMQLTSHLLAKHSSQEAYSQPAHSQNRPQL